MSMDVVITQHGLRKKPLPMEVILGESLHFGRFAEGWRLEEGETNPREFTAFLPDAIARGFSVIWRPGEKRRVVLRLLTPTGEAEIREFFRMVRRIMTHWNAALMVDGTRRSLEDWEAELEGYLQFNRQAFENSCRNILDDENGEMTFFSAKWPLHMGKAEAEAFENDFPAFEDWMHRMQSMDVYYAAAQFFRNEDGISGLYVLSENCRSVFPSKPYVPFGTTDPDTKKALECDKFETALYSETEQTIIGTLDYETFLQRLPPNLVQRYDEMSVLIEPLDLAELRALLKS